MVVKTISMGIKLELKVKDEREIGIFFIFTVSIVTAANQQPDEAFQVLKVSLRDAEFYYFGPFIRLDAIPSKSFL